MLRNPGLRKSVEQPVLDLNFAESQIGSNAAPDSRIDFSRGSNAWFVDSDGLVKKSPHNLLLRSEELDNASWTKEATANITANAAAAPDGSLTADQYFASASSGFARVSQTPTGVVDGQTYTYSVFVKANGYDYFLIRSKFRGSSANDNVAFDLSDGTISYEATGYTGFITDEGNGWFRVGFTVEAGSSGGVSGHTFLRFQPTEQTSNSISAITGDGSSGGYIWGAQTSQHTILPVDNPYIKTEGSAVYAAKLDHDASWFMSEAQEQNLFTNSEMLNETGSTGWAKVRTVVTEDSTEDPNGNTTAEKVLEDSTASSSHFVRSPDFTTTKGKSYTASAYVKVAAGTDRLFRIAFSGVDSAFGYLYAQFDLQSGSLNFSNADDSSITDVGNGWFRLSVTETASATADTAEVQLTFVDKAGSASYDGNGTSGFFVWGAQVEVGTSPGTYHRTTGAPYYGPGATPRGLLVEETRTNLITDSESHTYLDGDILVSQSGSAALAPDGTNTAIAFMETAGTGNHVSRKVNIPIAANTHISFSFFVKANGREHGSIEFFNAGGGYANFDLGAGTITNAALYASATNGQSSIEDFGNGWFRVGLRLRTVTSDTTGDIQIRIHENNTHTNSYAGDATKGLYIWGLQLEQGKHPSSYIKTTGSSVTRNSDLVTMGPTTGGTELVTNGTFDTDSDWTLPSGGNVTIASGVLNYSSAAQYKRTTQSLASSLVVGRRYRASFEVTSFTSGLVAMRYFENGSLATASANRGAVGTTTFDFTCTTLTGAEIDLRSQASGANTFQVDNVSVRELYPWEQYNFAEGTIFMEGSVPFTPQANNFTALVRLEGADPNTDRIDLRLNSLPQLSALCKVGGVNTMSLGVHNVDANEVFRFGVAFKEDSFAVASSQKLSASTDNSGAIATIQKMSLAPIDTYINAGHFKRILYFARRIHGVSLLNMMDPLQL